MVPAEWVKPTHQICYPVPDGPEKDPVDAYLFMVLLTSK